MRKYELIVIGGGVSGLSTAIAWLLNREGPVLVVEKEPVPGGCVASFARGGFRFDTVQLIPDMRDLLDYLGIDLPLRRYEGTLSRLFLADPSPSLPTRRFEVPADGDRFEEALKEDYPSERRRIGRFFGSCRAMVDELAFLKLEPRALDYARIIARCPRVVACSGDTWKRFLGRFGFEDPELVERLDLFSSYSGLSGDRCAALLTVSAMVTSLEASWRPATAFVELPVAMRRRVDSLGGEFRPGCRARKILFEADGRVRGVQTEEGEELLAGTVVSTVDTGAFLRDLVGEDRLRSVRGPYRDALSRLEMSSSMFAIHLGLDGGLDLRSLGLDGAYNVLTTGRSAHEAAFSARGPGASARRGRGRGWPRVMRDMSADGGGFHFAFFSPSIYNGSERQTLALHVSPVAAEPWISLRESSPEEYRSAKAAFAERYARILEERLVPGLSGHIRLIDVSTPATVARYLGSPTGSCYDMTPSLSQFGLKRLPLRTPFPGLYQTKFSHGIWPAMHAGLQVYDLISGGAIMGGGARYMRAPG
jgi:all-trans-retinol 13,14-reductase